MLARIINDIVKHVLWQVWVPLSPTTTKGCASRKSHRFLHFITGGSIVCLSHICILWLWQAGPVSFPIGHLGKLIQQNKSLRNHLLGQELGHMLAQLLCVNGIWRKVAHKVLLLDGVCVDHYQGLLHAWEARQVVLHLCQLYSHASQLYLDTQARSTPEMQKEWKHACKPCM
jgi:hypothetical protein